MSREVCKQEKEQNERMRIDVRIIVLNRPECIQPDVGLVAPKKAHLLLNSKGYWNERSNRSEHEEHKGSGTSFKDHVQRRSTKRKE
jgi:hypothetical protein